MQYLKERITKAETQIKALSCEIRTLQEILDHSGEIEVDCIIAPSDTLTMKRFNNDYIIKIHTLNSTKPIIVTKETFKSIAYQMLHMLKTHGEPEDV